MVQFDQIIDIFELELAQSGPTLNILHKKTDRQIMRGRISRTLPLSHIPRLTVSHYLESSAEFDSRSLSFHSFDQLLSLTMTAKSYLVDLAEKLAKLTTEATEPGRWLVDAFPICE